jgi:hypothetical protein
MFGKRTIDLNREVSSCALLAGDYGHMRQLECKLQLVPGWVARRGCKLKLELQQRRPALVVAAVLTCPAYGERVIETRSGRVPTWRNWQTR